jgi:hypothetical protein
MKKVILVLVVLFLVAPALAQDNYNDYQYLEVDFLLDAEIELSGSGTLNELTSTVYLYPQEDNNQEIFSLEDFSTPAADTSFNNGIIFEWTEKNPTYNFGYTSKIKGKNVLYKVPEVSLPYSDLSSEYQEYLQSEEIININSDIISKTSEIIENENNAYLAVHQIATWINDNIEYDLNTLTAKASKQSSWVLSNRQGVCDEIASLFISMTRSIGIPARFVSGVAYTNVDNTFGNHGWAEVYYPGYGWVPYDVTYDQFGWIDPSHISLQKSKDVESSILYKWKSLGDLELDSSREITTSAEISKEGNKVSPIFDGSITTLKDKVSPGSYVPIRITLKNPYDAYTSDQVVITKDPGLTESNQRMIAMKPLEVKESYWIVEIPERTQNNYLYTTTIEFVDLFGTKEATTIEFSDEYNEVTLSEAEEIIDKLTEDDSNSYSGVIVLNCNPTNSYFYSYKTAEVSCNVRTFNSAISGLTLCVKDSCEDFDMGTNQEKDISINLEPTKEIVPITLSNSEISMKRNLLLSIIDKPEIKISEIELTKVNYNEEIEIPITLSSETPLKDVVLKINKFTPLTLGDLEGTKELSFKLNSRELNSEKINMKLEFLDEFGDSHEQEYNQRIKVTNLPWYYKLINIFRR